MKHTLRAALAVALLVGFYAVALGVVAVLVLLVYEAFAQGLSGAALVKVAVVVGIVAFAVLKGLVTRDRTHREPPGVLLAEADQPRLWSSVRALADAVGTRPPDEIRLVPDVNAFVSEDAKLLGLVPGTRRLAIGAPLLVGLDHAQVRSVLAHELGHYSGKHTALGPVTYRGMEAIHRVLRNLGPDSWVGKLLGLYGKLYRAVSQSVSRRQELEADEFSARLAGRDAAASALQELAGLGAAWSFFARTFPSAAADHGLRPEHLFAGFAEMIADPGVAGQLDEIRAAADSEEISRSVYDSHPPVPERVAAIRRSDAPATVEEAGASAPGVSLLDDPFGAFKALEAYLWGDSAARPVGWDVIQETAARDAVQHNGSRLSGLLDEAGQPRTLRTVVDRLADGGATGLVPGADAEQDRTIVLGLLGAAVADRLVATHGATPSARWDGGVQLVGSDGAAIEPWALVRESADSGSSLASALETQGLDLDAVLPDPPQREPVAEVTADEDSVVGVIALVKSDAGRQLFVTHRGIVLRTNDGGDRTAAMLRAYAGNPAKAVLKRAAKHTSADLAGDDRATWFLYADLAEVSWEERTVRASRLELTRHDGTTVTVKVPSDVASAGEAFPAMQHYLRERFSVVSSKAATVA